MSRISFTHCLYWKTTYFPSYLCFSSIEDYHPGKVSNPLKIPNRKGAANFGHSTLSWWLDFLLDWNGQIVCLFGIYVDSKGIKSYYAVLTHKCEDSHFRKHDFIFHLRSSVSSKSFENSSIFGFGNGFFPLKFVDKQVWICTIQTEIIQRVLDSFFLTFGFPLIYHR